MDDQAFIARWQQGDKPVFLSPSCMEGVDLSGEQCRWQVLGKTPFLDLGDSRVRYILKERGDQRWYNSQTNMNIIQSAGRGVRHSEDWCSYYVLDEAVHGVIHGPDVPDWFADAIVQ